MKPIIVLFLLLSITSVFARQYIQCGVRDSFDGLVINLDGENSTIFMTNGVHLPDPDRVEILKPISLFDITQEYHIYQTQEDRIIEQVKIPNDVIGKYSSNFTILMGHKRANDQYFYEREMYCYSAIYED